MPYYDNYPNTRQYWESFISIVSETDNHFFESLDVDKQSPELSRSLSEFFINNARRMLALPTAGVNPEVLSLADKFVECYQVLSNHFHDDANYLQGVDSYQKRYKELDNPMSYVANFFEGAITSITGISNAFNCESTKNEMDKNYNSLGQMVQNLNSNLTKIMNNYTLLLSKTDQLRDRLFS